MEGTAPDTFCFFTALPDEDEGLFGVGDVLSMFVSGPDGALRFRDFGGVGCAMFGLPGVAADGGGSAASLVAERVTLGDMRIWIRIELQVLLFSDGSSP